MDQSGVQGVGVATGVAGPQPFQWSPEHLAVLRAAHVAGRRVRRAARVAAVDGWTIVVFGALTVLAGITDPATLAIGAILAGIGAVEVRGSGRLGRLDAGAARVLGWNQVVLGTLLLGYAAWRLVVLSHGDGGVAAILGEAGATADPEVRRMLAPVADLTRQVMVWTYGAMAAIAVAGPGSLAWYYFTRGRHVREYVARTPAWVVEMQRAGVAV